LLAITEANYSAFFFRIKDQKSKGKLTNENTKCGRPAGTGSEEQKMAGDISGQIEHKKLRPISNFENRP